MDDDKKNIVHLPTIFSNCGLTNSKQTVSKAWPNIFAHELYIIFLSNNRLKNLFSNKISLFLGMAWNLCTWIIYLYSNNRFLKPFHNNKMSLRFCSFVFVVTRCTLICIVWDYLHRGSVYQCSARVRHLTCRVG